MKSIRTKILSIVIFALLASTLLTGASGYIFAHKIMHQNANTILETIGRENAEEINKLFSDIEKSVQLISTYALHEIKSPEELTQPSFRDSYISKIESLFTSVANSTNGIVAYYFRPTPELTTCSSGFFISKDIETQQFQKIPPTDLSKYDPDDIEHVGWYYGPINAEKPIWMMPYYNKNNNIHMISYVIPLYCDQTLIGVLGMDVDFTLLTQAVNDIVIYDHGFAFLTDKDGTIIHAPPLFDTVDREKTDMYIEVGVPLQNGMMLITHAEYRDIQSNTRFLLFSILILSVILILVFSFVTVLATNQIVKPLRKLANIAKKIEKNPEIPFDLVCNTKDEVGTLSRVLKDASDRHVEYMNHINALAYLDSLTGTKNNTAYVEMIADLEKQMKLEHPEFGVLVADINNLKATNDTHGHDVGNRLIIQASRLLGGTFRHSNIFRIGGDEFVVLILNRDYENYYQLIMEFDRACNEESIEIGGKRIKLSMARGVACYVPDLDNTYNDVFRRADHAMYLHKKNTKSTQK